MPEQMKDGVTVDELCHGQLELSKRMDSTEIVIGSEVADDAGMFYEFQLQRVADLSENRDELEPPQLQEVQLVPSPSQMQEIMIKEYLTSHESWEVPASVLYEEPTNCVIQCDLSSWPEVMADDIMDLEDHSLQLKARKRGGRRHKGQFMKRPMATSEVIEELQDEDLRENALRCLSGHLIERREQDPEFYRQAGFFLFHSFGTLAILLQEILAVYERFYSGDLNVRGSKRLANVLCLLQSIAAHDEIRLQFVKACIPNYLFPFILSEYTEEIYENVRTISLSVIGILCQAREKEIIRWALRNGVIDMCFYAVDIGSELSKVIAMTILDSILRVDEGLSAMCEVQSSCCDLLPKFIKLCADLVSLLAVIQGFSPRLLFLVVRSYILLCQNYRALELLRDQLPSQLQDTTFRDVKMEYPLFSFLRHQLLLNTGKARDYLPSVPGSLEPSPVTPVILDPSDDKENCGNSSSSVKLTPETAVVYVTPMRPIDLNKRDWASSARL